MPAYPVKFELIEWVDSRGATDRWARINDLADHDCCKMISVGWVIAEDDTEMQVAPHVGIEDDVEDAQVCGVMVIPKRCITRRTTLNEG